ncbi:hypothetical protein RBB78_08615 [Tunturiibacter empetritectus]
MEQRPGNERTAIMTGRARTAVTLAAMVVLSAFATDNATPALARATDPVPVMHDVTTSEIVNTVTVPRRTVLTRIKSGLASLVWRGMAGTPDGQWTDLRHERDDGGAQDASVRQQGEGDRSA